MRSQTLDVLRFPLAAVIVVIHVFSSCGFVGRCADDAERACHPLLVAVSAFINGFLKSQSVPVYFFISGFVFFLGIELTKDVYLRKMRNRMKSLLVPYIIWNTIALLLLVVRFLPVVHDYAASRQTLCLSLSGLLSCYWSYDNSLVPEAVSGIGGIASVGSYPINVPLWFLRDLMIVALSAPLIWYVLRHTKHYVLCLAGVVWFVSGSFFPGHFYQLATAYFFFSFGAYMSVNGKDMLREFGRYFRCSLVVYPLLGVLHIAAAYYCPDLCPWIKRLNVFAGLLFAYNVAAWLLKRKICRVSAFLSSASFFVYVSHTLVYSRTTRLFASFLHPDGDVSLLCVYLLSAALTTGLSLSVFWVMRRYCPLVLKVVAGRK